MTKTSLTVAAGAANERLDVYLASEIGSSRAQAAKLLRAGLVVVNGQTARASYLVQDGDSVAVEETPGPAAPAEVPDLKVLYEDDDLLVVDKPAGLAVHPGAASHTTATVADFARRHSSDPDPERPGIIHRLDRDTSGILIIAKHAAAKAHMQAQFKQRLVHKTYQLLAVGRVEQEQAIIRLPLSRDPANPLQQAVQSGGREAETAYEVARVFTGYTHVIARPHTGRTHQLRVHFAALGHPVAGDIVYGPPKRPLGLKRQFLHASDIEFIAPSGQKITLHSDLPGDLAAVLASLEAAEAAV